MNLDVVRYNPGLGWFILAKAVKIAEFRVLLKLARGLGLKKNTKEELRSWRLRGKIAPRRLATKIYKGRNERLSVSHLPQFGLMGISWQSPRFDGHEFASLYLSILSQPGANLRHQIIEGTNQ